MPNKVNKVQKKQILQALYEDNAKLQRFQLGKVELQEQEQGQEVATRQGNVDWLNLIMFLVFRNERTTLKLVIFPGMTCFILYMPVTCSTPLRRETCQ